MNINLEQAIGAITSALHSGDIDPHSAYTDAQIHRAIEENAGPCRLCGFTLFNGMHSDGFINSHDFEPIV